jgi:hypothetical protein
MKWKIKRRLNSVLGLTLSDGPMRAVHVARSKDALQVVKSVSANLSLDILHPEPELVGREIKNHLDAAGIREKSCVISVPANWIMSLHAKLPELSQEDANSLLQIEAEKGFPYDMSQLQIARSFHRSAEAAYVTQLAVRNDRLDQLAAVAKAAGLKPVSFALGLASLPGAVPPEGSGCITVVLAPKRASLLVAAGGGIAAFRTSEAAIESEGGEHLVNIGAVARELRITFEQVPADLRAELKELRLCGIETMVAQLEENLGDWPAASGLKISRDGSSGDSLDERIAGGIAKQWLASSASQVEFLPVRPSRFSLLLARVSSKRLGSVGLAVGGVAVIVLAVFGWQQVQLSLLRSKWDGMQAQVAALSAIQDNIMYYRPWYDRSFPDLRILARITQCFPDSGSVTAKSIDVHHVGAITAVTISGLSKDERAFLRTQDQLRKAKEIQDLKVEAISGKIPAQFTFTFRWIGGGGS